MAANFQKKSGYNLLKKQALFSTGACQTVFPGIILANMNFMKLFYITSLFLRYL